MDERKDIRVKVVLLGASGVGKSSLAQRFVRGTFDSEQLPTIGAAYMTKKLKIGNELAEVSNYIFEIWDTAGQERYEAITPLYYKSSKAAIIVFDIGDDSTFQKCQEWFEKLRKDLPENVPIVLAGNKADMGSKINLNNSENYNNDRKELLNKVLYFSEENKVKFFETSAKTDMNVKEVFYWIAHNLPPEEETDNSDSVIIDEQQNLLQKTCCQQ